MATPAWAAGLDEDASTPAWAKGLATTAPTQPKRPGATGFAAIPETINTLMGADNTGRNPNAIEQGLMDVGNSKVLQGAKASYDQAVSSGLFMQPARAAMQGLSVGMKELKAKYPGKSDDWYKTQFNNAYSDAVQSSREDAFKRQQENKVGSYGPNATLGDKAARFGQQVTNLGANVVANPQYFALPGFGVGANAATRIGVSTAANAGVGAVSDAAAQLMDIATKTKKDFDVQQNLENTFTSGLFGGALHGAIEVAPFIKGLFVNRGIDTTPGAAPKPNGSPTTGDTVSLTPEEQVQFKQHLKTGSVDDIQDFLANKQGPKPSWAAVNKLVEFRDSLPENHVGQANLGQAVDNQVNLSNRMMVHDHIQTQMSDWKNAPQVDVHNTPADIPDPTIRAQALKEDPNGDALGFLGSDGKIRVFSDRIPDADTANAVLFHEGLGHFGLAEKFGSRLDQTIQSLLDRNVNQFSQDVSKWQKANPKAYGGDRVRAGEEVLAEASQNGQIKPSWKLALNSSIRQFGRKMGLKMGYNDAEVQHILSMAHDAVVNGKPNAAANGFRGAVANFDSPNKFMFTGQKATGFEPEHPTAFRGDKDKAIRNEISDRGAGFIHEGPLKSGNHRLGDILDHPKLYENYPELENLKVKVHGEDNPMLSGHKAYFNAKVDPPIMGLSPDASVSDVLHETQHAIQLHEGRISKNEEGSTIMSADDYHNDPREVEARSTEDRMNMSPQERYEQPPNWAEQSPTDKMGREGANPNLLGEVDRLKQDPRFWSDPEFRKNVIELGRTEQPIDTGPAQSNIPAPSGFKSEAEARAAQAAPKFMNRTQLAKETDYVAEDLEGIYKALDENYTPSTRTFQQTRQAALEAGFSPSQIKALKEHNAGDLSVRLDRMQVAANIADAKLATLHEKLDTPEWTIADQAKYLQTLADRNYLVTRIKGERAEIGRALNISKAARSYNASTMEQVKALMEENGSGLSDLTDPTRFMKFAQQIKALMANGNPQGAHVLMQGVNAPYWEQYLNSTHMSMMLSAFSTQAKNVIDNARGIGREVIESAIAMPIGALRQAAEVITGRTPKPGVSPEELAMNVWGMVKAVTNAEVYRSTLQAAKTGEGGYVGPNNQRVPTNFMKQYGAVNNPRIPVLSIPTDLLMASDTFFKSVAMNKNLLGLGAREARAQLGPKATRADVMTLAETLATNPTKTMLDEAKDLSERTLLMNNSGITSMVEAGRTYKPGLNPLERVGRFIVYNLAPFIRVQANSLINRIVQRSPLGFLDPYTQGQLKAGGAKADLALSRIAYGSALIGMYWVAADPAKKKIFGQGPDDRLKNQEAQAGGFSPNSVKKDGKYVTANTLPMSLNPLDKHNGTATMVADLRNAYEKGANQGQVGTGIKLALGSLIHNMADQSWIGDVTPLLAAIESRGDQGVSATQSFIASQARSWSPNGMSQIARMQDRTKRDTTPEDPNSIIGRVVNELKATVPGVRESLPIKYSVYGNPLEQGASLTGISSSTKETTDPTEKELQRLAQSGMKITLDNGNVLDLNKSAIVTPVLRTIDPSDDDIEAIQDSGRKDLKVEDGKIKLTPKQFQEYQRVAGRAIVESVKESMSTSEWQSMSDEDKVLEIREIQTDMKKAAREALFYEPK